MQYWSKGHPAMKRKVQSIPTAAESQTLSALLVSIKASYPAKRRIISMAADNERLDNGLIVVFCHIEQDRTSDVAQMLGWMGGVWEPT